MTYIIIAFTVIITITAFNNSEFFSKFQFNAYQVYHRKEIYRLLSHGFLHANWTHLIVNMLALFLLGPVVEQYFKELMFAGIIKHNRLIFILFYLIAIVVSSLVSLFKQKNDAWYNSVGASGAVSAIIFFYIFFNPWKMLYVYGILPVPGIILGALYLIYSQFMSKRNIDNINHDAHFIGAVFGFIFPVILDYRLLANFITEFLRFY
jgi:membrane associated rhomboid family serine protease